MVRTQAGESHDMDPNRGLNSKHQWWTVSSPES